MTWLKIGDELARQREWLALEDIAYERTAGPIEKRIVNAQNKAALAKLVHLTTSMWGADSTCDGIVTRSAVAQVCAIASITPDQWYEAVELLQAARMWHPRKQSPWQMLVTWAPGDQPTAAAERDRKRKTRRRAALHRNAPLKLDVIERGGGQCEYCDTPITAHEGEFDHIDPSGDNDLDNLAFVCTSCNKRKGNETLDAMRMAFTARAKRRRSTWAAKR